jgi:hypothetical protein
MRALGGVCAVWVSLFKVWVSLFKEHAHVPVMSACSRTASICLASCTESSSLLAASAATAAPEGPGAALSCAPADTASLEQASMGKGAGVVEAGYDTWTRVRVD